MLTKDMQDFRKEMEVVLKGT